jgi:hypothetical protein
MAEELEQEQAIFNEVLKKRYQGFNAHKLGIMADRARLGAGSKKSSNQNLGGKGSRAGSPNRGHSAAAAATGIIGEGS